jgi:prepilin-type N-terminal cleavage/methylation domain-containing protein
MEKSRGFSLIELLTTVAIMGILSRLAHGYYRGNVFASNRAEGRSVLQTAAVTLINAGAAI